MKYILARSNIEILRQFAWSRVLLAFDFDGTLAPIVADPERARMRATTATLLRRLARAYPCVVISGRARDDVARLVRGVHLDGVIGNHGIEPWHGSSRLAERVADWRRQVEDVARALPGVSVEDKGYSLSIHYRKSRERKKARRQILDLTARFRDARIVGGKQVVNVLPSDGPHKGLALDRERRRLRCDTALFVGDDSTDEDVFELTHPGQLLSVRVGRNQSSLAAYYLKDQREIDRFLRTMLALRPDPARRSRR
jgi:trehalose 6-phosphate phosphatase